MTEKGFTLVEVLIATALLTLVAGLNYQLVVAQEEIHRENMFAQQMNAYMQVQLEEWRRYKEKRNQMVRIDDVEVTQEIVVTRINEYRESGEFTFAWKYRNRLREVNWVIDRFVP